MPAAALRFCIGSVFKNGTCALPQPPPTTFCIADADDSPRRFPTLVSDPRPPAPEKAFLTALSDLCKDFRTPELDKVPRVFFGAHSRGGICSDVMPPSPGAG